MIQALPKLLTFEQFLEWYPDGKGRYELINGVVVEMLPTGNHEEVTAFTYGELFLEVRKLSLPYLLPRTCLVKSPFWESGYQPDVIILDKEALKDEPLWQQTATISFGKSVKLAVEVVSTNWRNDYLTKLRDYEEIGIPEYWILDHLGLGGLRYIGNPKRPTLSVYQLMNGEYQVSQFREDEPIKSLTFPEMNLTAQQVFMAGSLSP